MFNPLRWLTNLFASSETRFQQMTPEQKRVMIAQDALVQIKANKFVCSRGNYVCLPKFTEPYEKVELRDIVKQTSSCKVCARGALFLATILRIDQFKGGDAKWDHGNLESTLSVDNNSSFLRYEEQFFSPEQLALIELAFEGGSCGNRVWSMPKYKSDSWLAAMGFCKDYPDPTDRLVAILENIIENKGTFILPEEQ